MAFHRRASGRAVVVAFALVALLTLTPLYRNDGAYGASLPFRATWSHSDSHQALFHDLSLTEEQCASAFPGLTKEIDDAVARGPFDFEKAPEHAFGVVNGRIKNNKLYIISAAHDQAPNILERRTATLHQLHRALTTTREPLPDTYFTLSVNDDPRNNSWSYSRPLLIPSSSHHNHWNHWLMPHFSFWSWPLPQIGPWDHALAKIATVENNTPWNKKIDKAVWRGTSWFNPIGNKQLRPDLIETSKGKEWADVRALDGPVESNIHTLDIEDFCRYKYIIYTEGVTYSGRLPYHTACTSVIITPPLSFLQHTSHLIKPFRAPRTPDHPTPTRATDPSAWRKPYSPETGANVVFVRPDWSDLESTIKYLRAHPDVASRISRNSRAAFLDAGYLSPASETCYWRSLVRGWSRVARPVMAREARLVLGEVGEVEESFVQVEGWDEVGGVRWESFVLGGKTAPSR